MSSVYQEPLVSRYTSKEMQVLFSEDTKFQTWRKCWVALAEAQYELGLTDLINQQMIREMKDNMTNIDLAVAAEKEKEIRHDVMAHVYEFGTKCPSAEKIIHLGATSQYVVCNTDLILQRKGLMLIKNSLLNVISNLINFCEQYKDLPTLGFTHYQPAQPTTVGKRNTLYLHDLFCDLDYLEFFEQRLLARGAKGTVGTQATFLQLFKGDHEKVRALDNLVAEKLGFTGSLPVTGQTYSRKQDIKLAELLSGIGATAHKFGVDLRLLSNLKVQEEPFAKNQTGSSAMAYKRNPMRSERMTGLARKLINLVNDFNATYANQWFERTLDDSAIRRMDIPQSFLLTDAILKLFVNITSDMVVYPKQIERQIRAELPFMATEKILMAAVSRGQSRQLMHEVVKEHSVDAGKKVKMEAEENDLLERLAEDDRVPFSLDELNGMTSDLLEFTGRASQQTTEYLEEIAKPRLSDYQETFAKVDAQLNV
ncbi:MAG: adenylosuccinate lyase [Desulfobulbaceae bacterium]|nr:MAG: adenylosuccinate lyase [Desulfobulbaceae bacterium]